MRIEKIRLVDFRNYRETTVEPGAGITILVGANATGKTNLVEAVQVATTTESFRRPKWADLVRWGAERAEVAVSAEGEGHTVDLRLTVGFEGRRRYELNGKAKRRMSDVIGAVPTVVFTPDDLRLVSGSGERRRAALDGIGEQLWPAHRKARTEYERALRQRNQALKDPRTGDRELGPWDEQIARLGASLVESRTRTLALVAREACPTHDRLSGGESLDVRYSHALDVTEAADGRIERGDAESALREGIQARRADELARRVTLVGPHRDDVLFLLGDRPARAFASQGQRRTIALAWKMAELAVLEQTLGRTPVLLLDDVMSELDADRRDALTDSVERDVQTWITTTNPGYFGPRLLERAEVVRL